MAWGTQAKDCISHEEGPTGDAHRPLCCAEAKDGWLGHLLCLNGRYGDDAHDVGGRAAA